MQTQAHTLETSIETFCAELDAYLKTGVLPQTPKAQDFGPQNHAAFRKTYRHSNPMISAEQTADLAVILAWSYIEAEMADCAPVEPMHTSPLSLLSEAVDTASLIETQIDLMQGRAVSPSAKSNLIDSWIAGQASYAEVIQAHAPKATYTQTLVKRAYAVAYNVAGYIHIR